MTNNFFFDIWNLREEEEEEKEEDKKMKKKRACVKNWLFNNIHTPKMNEIQFKAFVEDSLPTS